MPATGLPPSEPVRADAPKPPNRQLPPHRSKLGRIADHASGLATESIALARYRVQLASTSTRRQVKEQVVRTKTTIEETKNAYLRALGPTLALAIGGLILLLVTFGFLVSALFHAFLIANQIWALTAGFGTAMALLLAAAGIWFKVNDPARKEKQIQARVDAAVAEVRKEF